MTTTADPLKGIFAYRVFDLRDRFPEPVETFREALACLQSDRAYLPELSGDIVAYVRGGYAITIPASLYLRRKGNQVVLVDPKENERVEVEATAWLRTALREHAALLAQPLSVAKRPYSLDELLAQCDPNAADSEELRQWRAMPDVGREDW
ncbi:MAG: hypothetical protein EI684_01655 [Candidatus Viridilinea halotolerans]|uniref:Uncharacterized protein n=1 Tax=Candidatus Viridilinea halotolerans TaxID=2491704 RepID=A0A426UA12_9CHLR|nr:MAG: hypothetical protein EI684_01655 [Candidatus Viridilinea halotolerans]